MRYCGYYKLNVVKRIPTTGYFYKFSTWLIQSGYFQLKQCVSQPTVSTDYWIFLQVFNLAHTGWILSVKRVRQPAHCEYHHQLTNDSYNNLATARCGGEKKRENKYTNWVVCFIVFMKEAITRFPNKIL